MEKIIEQTAKEIVEKSGLKPVSEQFIYDEESNTYWYSIEGSLGNQKIKDQEILSSLNHLLRRIIETKITKENTSGQEIKVPMALFDINGAQRKKIENLKTIAHMMAERARYFKSKIAVDPMSPYDRRIIHEFLSTKPDIKTESDGEGRSRHVVIYYTGK
ncbi:hypothetical protein KC842_01195 [Candidatus Nomurabacteria bacterium]|nr:hypothetical protein [Candidatus Nomurabacteria bacterium]USN94670.1 MAG: hypothetical protein H6791_02850 [Candidatus Nomurabacteria bacterium]